MMSSRMAWRAAASPSFPFLAAVLPVLVPFLAGWKASCSSARAADTNSWGRCLRQRRRRWPTGPAGAVGMPAQSVHGKV